MLEDFFQISSAISVYWTLKIELVIYGTFSLLFVLNLHQRTGWLIAGLFAAEVAPRLLQVCHGSAFEIANTKFYYFAPLMGLLAYRFLHGQCSTRPMVIVAIGQALLLLASWTIDHALGRADPVDDGIHLMHAVIWPIGYAAFFLALACRRRLSSAVFSWLGKMSYSVYLLHMPVLGLLLTLHQTGWAFYVALFAGTLVLSDMSYRWIEAPSITLGRALEKRLLGRRPTVALPREPAATPGELCEPRLAA
jgi:peptidoglycan/LPS O-acetylase OafA/YrhL